MSTPSFYIANDYAGISGTNFSAYYGYERVDADGNWCFVATLPGRVVTIPSTELGCKDTFDPGLCLLAGLAKILETHELTPKGP